MSFLCLLAFRDGADRDDKLRTAKPVEVACSFEAETDVGASDDDGLIREGLRWVGWCTEELGVEGISQGRCDLKLYDEFFSHAGRN